MQTYKITKDFDMSDEDIQRFNQLIDEYFIKNNMRYLYSASYGNSNYEIDQLISFISKFSYDELRIMLALNGLFFPDDELSFYEILLKMSRKSSINASSHLKAFIKLMLIRNIDRNPDRSLLRLFRKSQLKDLFKLLNAYNITKKTNQG